MTKSTIIQLPVCTISLVALLLTGCASTESVTIDETVLARAKQLSQDYVVFDAHVDLPLRMRARWEDITQRTRGDFDLVRAKEGGLDAMFMSIYTSPSSESLGTSKQVADSLIDVVDKMVATWPDKFTLAVTPVDVLKSTQQGRISLGIGLENGSALLGSMENLMHFYSRGARYITLCHMKDNQICDSSTDTTHTWQGLSPFGKDLVPAMNRLGIMIDVSHVGDTAIEQILELSTAPILASHSCARALTPGLTRNLPDNLIKKIADRGGMVCIGFGSFFLGNEYNARMDSAQAEIDRYLKENNLKRRDSLAREYTRKYWMNHSRKVTFGSAKDIALHIDHVVKNAGIDHVGIGSDFEGGGDSFPEGVRDVSGYPNVIYELLIMGYKDEEIKKVFGENLLRVWESVEKASKQSQSL
jgi:membrane dipeptidase